MTDEELMKERKRLRPDDLHFKCGEFTCTAHESWTLGFSAAVELIRVREVGPLKKQVFALNELTAGLMEKDIRDE